MNEVNLPHNNQIDLTCNLGPLQLKNPITVASGTFGYGLEFCPYLDITELGAIVVKGLTLKPLEGHPQVRLSETAAGMLNCIGLQNIGYDAFVSEKLPKLRELGAKIIVNINGSTVEEYVELAAKLSNQVGISALEINVSCPNVKAGGIVFGIDPQMIELVTTKVRKITTLPLIVKLSPNVTDITLMAKAAENGGADVLSLINTLLGMAVDFKSRKTILSNVTGGLSGPAIKPIALRCIWEVYQNTKLPLIGMGGICNAEDALEFMITGSSAISIGTANFLDPSCASSILNEIKQIMFAEGISAISDIVGSLDIYQ